MRCVLAVLAVGWCLIPSPVLAQDATMPDASPLTLAPSALGQPLPLAGPALPGPVDGLSLGFGSSAQDVERILGKPTRVVSVTGGENWFYGLSNVTIFAGRVVGWCTFERPLPMNIGTARPGAPKVTVGLSVADVVAAEGTPKTVADFGESQIWFYAKCGYTLQGGKVIRLGYASSPPASPTTPVSSASGQVRAPAGSGQAPSTGGAAATEPAAASLAEVTVVNECSAPVSFFVGEFTNLFSLRPNESLVVRVATGDQLVGLKSGDHVRVDGRYNRPDVMMLRPAYSGVVWRIKAASWGNMYDVEWEGARPRNAIQAPGGVTAVPPRVATSTATRNARPISQPKGPTPPSSTHVTVTAINAGNQELTLLWSDETGAREARLRPGSNQAFRLAKGGLGIVYGTYDSNGRMRSGTSAGGVVRMIEQAEVWTFTLEPSQLARGTLGWKMNVTVGVK